MYVDFEINMIWTIYALLMMGAESEALTRQSKREILAHIHELPKTQVALRHQM